MPTQPRNLVTEDEDPDCQMGDGASLQTEKLEHPDEGKTDKDNATVHCPLSTVHCHWPGVRVATLLLGAAL